MEYCVASTGALKTNGEASVSCSGLFSPVLLSRSTLKRSVLAPVPLSFCVEALWALVHGSVFLIARCRPLLNETDRTSRTCRCRNFSGICTDRTGTFYSILCKALFWNLSPREHKDPRTSQPVSEFCLMCGALLSSTDLGANTCTYSI